MKKILSLFIILSLLVNLAPSEKAYASDNKIETSRGNYTMYSEYIEEESVVVISAYENGEYIKTIRIPVYEDNDSNYGLATAAIPVPKQTSSGFGYHPQTTYWIYACSQELVDSGKVSFRGIHVGLNSIPHIQELFRNLVDEAVDLEEKVENANQSMYISIITAIISALAGYLNPEFFVATVIAYVEALHYQVIANSYEEQLIIANSNLANYFITLHRYRM